MAYSFYRWCGKLLLILLVQVFMGAKRTDSHKPANLFMPHPTYISITEMNHNKADQILEISCKLYFDDFEKVLSELHKIPVDLTQPKDKIQVNKLVGDYLVEHLKLKLDGKPVAIQYLGYEREREAAWCYLQVEKVNAIKKAEVFNDIFYKQFESQINLIHLIVNGNRKSARLNQPNTLTNFEF